MTTNTTARQTATALGLIARPARGPRAHPSARQAALNTTFNGLYLRPNQSNGGTVPASSPVSSSPDIWISGTAAVANFQTALATTNSYATQSPAEVQQGVPNNIYVRALNGSSTVQSASVQLYGLPCGVLQWPSKWAEYAIPTDIEHDPTQPAVYANPMNNVQPGAIGVAEQTFVWANPAPPPAGSDHYCFVSWLNTPSNPFPDVMSSLDLSALITSNLGFGWRNVGMVSGAQATVAMQTQLDIPSNIVGGSQEYFIIVTPTGFPAGWQIQMGCSRADDKGNQIAVTRQNVASQPGQFIGCYAFLTAGFSGTLTLSLFSNGSAPAPGAKVDIQVQYVPTVKELDRALREGLVDAAMSRALASAFRGELGIGPTAVCRMGSDGLLTY